MDMNVFNMTLYGRYMIANGEEFPCRITSVSDNSIRILPLSDRYDDGMDVILYCDVIGRIEGMIKNSTSEGFDVSINLSQKRLIDRLLSSAADDSVGDYVENLTSDTSSLITSSGEHHPCRMLYSNEKEATIEADILTVLGARVILNERAGHISEIHANGMKVSFSDE